MKILRSKINNNNYFITIQYYLLSKQAKACAPCGGVAQLGEHLPCKQGVRSSILLISTTYPQEGGTRVARVLRSKTTEIATSRSEVANDTVQKGGVGKDA